MTAIRPNIKRSVSTVPDDYAPSFAVGREWGYFLFPNTDVGDAESRACRGVTLRQIDADHIWFNLELPVTGAADILERTYMLDRSLQATQLTLTEAFFSLHRQFRQEGRLNHDWSDSEKQQLMKLERVIPAPAK